MIIWINGELTPLDDARVSPLDHGLVVGDGVFETLRVYGGVPFAWTRHLERLHASATGLGLVAPDAGELRAAADAVLAANDLAEARLRITVTGGAAPPGFATGARAPDRDRRRVRARSTSPTAARRDDRAVDAQRRRRARRA